MNHMDTIIVMRHSNDLYNLQFDVHDSGPSAGTACTNHLEHIHPDEHQEYGNNAV